MQKFYVDTHNNKHISEAIQQAAFDAGYGWDKGDYNMRLINNRQFIMLADFNYNPGLCLYTGQFEFDVSGQKFTIEQALQWFKENPKGFKDGNEAYEYFLKHRFDEEFSKVNDNIRINNLAETCSFLQSELAKLKEENEKLKYELMLAKTDSKIIIEDKLKSENEKLKSNNDGFIQRIAELDRDFDRIRSENADLKQQLEKSQQTVDLLARHLDTILVTLDQVINAPDFPEQKMFINYLITIYKPLIKK